MAGILEECNHVGVLYKHRQQKTESTSKSNKWLPAKKTVLPEKSRFIVPLGKAFIKEGIAKAKKGVNLSKLTRSDVKKLKLLVRHNAYVLTHRYVLCVRQYICSYKYLKC